jgi:16S rRNA (adenine1518-N6/adenine1519-N6)-dimethyltransferase
VTPSKKRGQSFLHDSSIAAEIVKSANLIESESVLEIGGGLGILTTRLAELAGTVTVIEIESGLVQALSEALAGFENVEILQGDVLTIDLPKVDKVVSNLPYSISSDVTFKILEELRPTMAVLMYQHEFAERLLATPGSSNYSRLTIDATYLADIERILTISAESFYPVPAVDSTVVRMTPRLNGPRAKDDDVFRWVVRGIYSYPKKMLRKALGFWLQTMKFEKQLSKEIIQRCKLDGNTRLRTLDLGSLVKLADAISDLISDGVLPSAGSS